VTVVDRPGRRILFVSSSEVSRRILRRYDAEGGSGGGRQTRDGALDGLVGRDVRNDSRLLSGPHFSELVFLEVRIDPKAFRGDDGNEVGAVGDVSSDLRGTIADKAVDRRTDFGIAEIELGCRKVGFGRLDGGFRLRDLCTDHGQLLLGRSERCCRAIDGRPGLVVRRGRFLRVLFGAAAGQGQRLIALCI
jgi:hypothetical protein